MRISTHRRSRTAGALVCKATVVSVAAMAVLLLVAGAFCFAEEGGSAVSGNAQSVVIRDQGPGMGGQPVTLGIERLRSMGMGNAGREMEARTRGGRHTYRGIPLPLLAAGGKSAPRKLQEIVVEGADGYTVTLSAQEVQLKSLILALWRDGKEIAPQLVGPVDRSFWVKGVRSVEFTRPAGVSAEDPQRASFRFIVETAEGRREFSLRELASSPFFVEGKGGFVTSTGKRFVSRYGGVPLIRLISSAGRRQGRRLTPTDTVVAEAVDGYRLEYAGGEVLDDSNGVWILALAENGAPIPLDPGYLRIVKILPDGSSGSVPMVEGRHSLRMVSRIVVRRGGTAADADSEGAGEGKSGSRQN